MERGFKIVVGVHVALGLLLGWLAWPGCVAEGSRTVEVQAFGMTFGFTDEVAPNADGEQVYKTSVDLELLTSWLTGRQQLDQKAKTEEPDGVEGG